MDRAVISDSLSSLINGRKVQSAVFTSYNFEPHFFEVDIIPYLLKDSIPYSNDDRVKKYQVMEALRDSDIEIEVFFDQPVFESADQSPAMEYLYHGVNLLPYAFHAKNSYLLVEDKVTRVQELLMAAGSNNLTRAGWWENIETQHWEVINLDKAGESFINQLRSDLSWLKQQRKFSTPNSAIEKIESFLQKCQLEKYDSYTTYYDVNQNNFFEFIQNNIPSLLEKQDCHLEIISPFFVNDPESLFHEQFFEMGVQDIVMILPLDQDKNALCDLNYYETIRKSERVSWGEWSDKNAAALGVDKKEDQFRKLHAKVFHFYNDHESCVFTGSVNFTRNAIYHNVETGFLIRQPAITPLLQPISSEVDVKCIENLNENELEISEDSQIYFDIHLGYDWKEKKLKGKVLKRSSLEINVLNQEGDSIIKQWGIGEDEATYQSTHREIKLLEALLKQTGFINIVVNDMGSENKPKEQRVLVLQTGWSHKPYELPDLTPGEILLIYAGMSEERRQILLMNARIKSFLRQNLGGELNSSDDDLQHAEFFCEYAEIFHAFRKFKDRLKAMSDNDKTTMLDYYLSGTGVDSLPALITKATDPELKSYDATVSYLLLLSVYEILSFDLYKSRINVKAKKEEVEKILRKMESSEELKLEQGTDRKKFFVWFREQFLKSYSNGHQVEQES